MQLALHGLLNPLNLGSTKGSSDLEVLTALTYILMLVLISPAKTRLYACLYLNGGISSDQSETLQIFDVLKEKVIFNRRK